MRIYKSVRLASITSIWVNELIYLKEKQLEESIKNGLVNEAEKILLKQFPLLNGVSRNITFKVSFSSIVEMCYRDTADYSIEKWDALSKEIENSKALIKNIDTTDTTTPKLYLDEEVWSGLEEYQRKFMNEENKRVLRLSYVIKLVIFAGYKKYQKS